MQTKQTQIIQDYLEDAPEILNEALPETRNEPAPHVRINKAIADAGVCSRRAADALIEAGHVLVNGMPVNSPGMQIFPLTDTLTIKGKAVQLQRYDTHDDAPVYLLLHKPIHVVSTAKDPEGRTTVLEFIPEALQNKRLYPVGRLDFLSEGLILLTNDGTLANHLTHPRYQMERTYHLLLRGTVSEDAFDIMREGMTLAEGEQLAPVIIERLDLPEGKTGTYIEMTLQQGLNRQIRRMCRDLDLVILILKRVSHGPLHLGGLPLGKTRLLTKGEVNDLMGIHKLP